MNQGPGSADTRSVGRDAGADRPIGVFDSGVGGLSVLDALRRQLPREHFVYFADSAHAPYGERDEAHVADRSRAVVQLLLEAHQIKAFVVACNTATAAAIHLLRAQYPGLPVVGVEPALKPAVAASRTGRIGVLATRGTLASRKFQALRDSLARSADFVLQPCDGLAHAIEADDATKIIALCARYTGALGTFGTDPGQIDTLVLGCTHYPLAAEALRRFTGESVRFFDTGEPVARRAHQLLAAANQLRHNGQGSVRLMASARCDALERAAARWLDGSRGPAAAWTAASASAAFGSPTAA